MKLPESIRVCKGKQECNTGIKFLQGTFILKV